MSGRAYALAIVGTLAALVLIIRQVRLRKLRAKYALLWLAVGFGLVPLAVIPGGLDWLAELLGVAYPPALLLVMGLGFFAVLCLHFSYELSRLEERSRVLAEEVALLREHVERPQARPFVPAERAEPSST